MSHSLPPLTTPTIVELLDRIDQEGALTQANASLLKEMGLITVVDDFYQWSLCILTPAGRLFLAGAET